MSAITKYFVAFTLGAAVVLGVLYRLHVIEWESLIPAFINGALMLGALNKTSPKNEPVVDAAKQEPLRPLS